MSKHTPGPWRWVDIGSALRLFGVDTSDEEASYASPIIDDGSVYGEYTSWIKSVDEPDACLIAAAPELLAACKAVFKDSKIYMLPTTTVNQIRAAIIKAGR